MSSQKPVLDLYKFTNNFDKKYFKKHNISCQHFSPIKGYIGELQVLDTLNKLGGIFFARFCDNKFKNGCINIQGFFRNTYFLIRVKFSVYELNDPDIILDFKNAINMFENVVGFFYSPSGISISCENYLDKIKFVDSLEKLSTTIQQLSLGISKKRIIFEISKQKYISYEISAKLIQILERKKLIVYSIRFGYSFPFHLENNIGTVGYVGFDYVGTYEFHNNIYHVAIRDERRASKEALKKKHKEFTRAMDTYLPSYYFGVLLISYNSDEVNLKRTNNIIFSRLDFITIKLQYILRKLLESK
ncbi:1285_t:CDS:1 [Dentiscutata erythropus]|uniref:1285_t:CDS:1 n=1 Tax=Dentiscutata erythropus TaxID=1348616 RepID=A0A9N9JSS8_9GLOM|nr:1285_t:CDS:1 [Dentiscutata erythropus]